MLALTPNHSQESPKPLIFSLGGPGVVAIFLKWGLGFPNPQPGQVRGAAVVSLREEIDDRTYMKNPQNLDCHGNHAQFSGRAPFLAASRFRVDYSRPSYESGCFGAKSAEINANHTALGALFSVFVVSVWSRWCGLGVVSGVRG